MPALLLTHPVSGPTTTVTLNPAFARLVNPQATPIQMVHVAQGGKAFVFTPGGAPVINRVLPVEIRNLHEANEGSNTGWAAVLAFLLNTLQGARNQCRLTDPDGTSYVARFMSGLETITEVQLGRFSGTLTFREDPLMPRNFTAGVSQAIVAAEYAYDVLIEAPAIGLRLVLVPSSAGRHWERRFLHVDSVEIGVPPAEAWVLSPN